MKVAIVGGGVIGLCCAHWLATAGADVVVVEQDVFGSGASSGNAGWITQSLSAPLAAPGVIRHALAWMLKPNSPLRLQPSLSPRFAGWLFEFCRASTRARYEHGLRAIVRLNSTTFELFDQLRRDGVAFEMHNAGVLFAARSERVLTEHGSMIAQLRAAGYRGAITSYDRTALLRLEPTLNQSVVGGFHAEDERHVRVETLINGLVANLRSQGTELLEHTVVTALARERARWRLRTATGAIHADTVVVAAGVGSRVLLQSLPYRIALEGAKGYSLTYRHSIDVPRHAIYLAEGKATISPFNDGVRITGLLEIPVQSRSVGQRQIATITDVANSYLRRPVPTSSAASWSGIRPLLPNCLPLIGPVPGAEHLYVATGHGILGVTLAPATAASLTALIINRRVGPELLPFLPLGGQLPSPTVEFETDETDDFTGPRHR